jgi:Poxvirus A22 protein
MKRFPRKGMTAPPTSCLNLVHSYIKNDVLYIGMLLLSIDVGIINIGMCLIETSTKKIKQWDCGGIPTESKKGLFVSLRDHFRERPWVMDASKILIEKQPDRNKRMKAVEHFMTAYFICNDKDIQVYDARHKIPDVVGAGKVMYRKRKNASVTRCQEFINEHNKEWVNFFASHKKKDDLADSVMQALSFREVPIAQKVVKPRKPTVNQTNTMYSRSNLAWLLMNDQSSTVRFQKDLKRYYSSVDELKSEFNI